MEITPHILENKPSLTDSSWSLIPLYSGEVQYHITKKNLLYLRFTAVVLAILNWVIMLVVCLQPKWVTLEHFNKNLRKNVTLNFALWNNCAKCLPTKKLSVNLIISRGIMFLNLIFTSLLIISMTCSFRRIFSRIPRLDFVFSIANYLAGLALCLCISLFGLQVLEIFQEKGESFHIKWPFYFSGFGILNFIVAGTICLNNYKNSWKMKFPQKSLSLSNKHSLCGSLWHQSSVSVMPQVETSFSIASSPFNSKP